MKVPLYHMEAGNRCFDQNVPEETNRKLVDRIADFNLVYTEHARRHLLSEGLPHRRIYLTGSPLCEVLNFYRPRIDASPVLADLGLDSGGYFLVSLHREENVDNPDRLRGLVATLEALATQYQLPVVVSTHPRTRKRLEDLNLPVPDAVRFMKPFGFLDYNALQLNARCVLSDSGSISEEAAILGFPAVTVREAIERPEALDAGAIILTGLHPEVVLNAVELAVAEHHAGKRPSVPVEYQVGNCSQRVVRLIMGTAKLSNAWDGIRARR